ncbi:Mitochondrial-processing peptidase subunit alpha [Spathaspora sp. JA1]|nr:Mitochondrial-processing peptidase subunit alpha [Spathaspora sp. JA1]
MLSRTFKSAVRKLSTATSQPHLEITTLANGLRLITDSTPGHFSALGAFIQGGSRFEDPAAPGLSHLCERLAWKTTEKYSGTQMLETLSKLGGNYIAVAQRDTLMYQATVFNKDVGNMLECMAQTIRHQQITDQEFAETVEGAKYEVSELAYKPDILLPEKLHQVAYSNNTLGVPFFTPQDRLAHIKKKEMTQYFDKFFQPQNVVIAMIGVPHEIALNLVLSNFSDWQNSSATAPELGTVNYTGGEISLPHTPPLYANQPELYHMQIAFETNGFLHDDMYALATLQKLLGGGSSFSAGGPGKGMFSRLYTQVLNKHPYVENCSAFNHSYADSGLFGITISLVPEAGHISTEIICNEFAKVLDSKEGLNEKEFTRAKNQLTSSLLMNVESKLAKLEDLGRQIQMQGKITSVDEMVDKIGALTMSDLRTVAEKVFTGKVVTKGVSSGTPSVVMQGERNSFGDVEFVLRQYGLGKF